MMDYGIYLSVNDGSEGFRIPVNPPEIEIKEAGQGKTYTVVKLGEINVIKEPKLTEISFESFFPAQRYPFVVGQRLLEPLAYVNLLKKWLDKKQVVRFVLTGSAVDINIPVSIEGFSWEESAGAVGDIEYELSLKKYVYHAPKRVVIQQQAQKTAILEIQTPRPVERKTPATYTLVKGDNLWKIAQKFLGSGARYKEIQELNGITDAQLRKLPIGLVIRLPPE